MVEDPDGQKVDDLENHPDDHTEQNYDGSPQSFQYRRNLR